MKMDNGIKLPSPGSYQILSVWCVSLCSSLLGVDTISTLPSSKVIPKFIPPSCLSGFRPRPPPSSISSRLGMEEVVSMTISSSPFPSWPFPPPPFLLSSFSALPLSAPPLPLPHSHTILYPLLSLPDQIIEGSCHHAPPHSLTISRSLPLLDFPFVSHPLS